MLSFIFLAFGLYIFSKALLIDQILPSNLQSASSYRSYGHLIMCQNCSFTVSTSFFSFFPQDLSLDITITKNNYIWSESFFKWANRAGVSLILFMKVSFSFCSHPRSPFLDTFTIIIINNELKTNATLYDNLITPSEQREDVKYPRISLDLFAAVIPGYIKIIVLTSFLLLHFIQFTNLNFKAEILVYQFVLL